MSASPTPLSQEAQATAATAMDRAGTAGRSEELATAQDRLSALLDGIDERKGDNSKRKRDLSEEDKPTQITASPYEWRRAFDPASSKYYYYNHRTNVTQWERPDAFIDPPSAAPAADYTAVASFSSKNGAFASEGGGSYWDQVGRANDREGRQMSAFFDMTSFEQNREDAKKKKEQLQKSGVDWRKYKEEKKSKKQKLTNRWLYEEDA